MSAEPIKHFWLNVFIATLFIFLLLWGIFKVTQLNLFNEFDSIGKALGDVDLTDYVFWGLRDDPSVDENIVIVNIAELSRREIAQQISIISQYEPRVIGIDSFFDCPYGRDTVNCPELTDVLGNLMLSEAIREAGNVVLVTKLERSMSLRKTDPDMEYDSLERSDSIFFMHAYGEGFANLDTDAAFQEDVKTCRAFFPRMTMMDGREELAFGTRIAVIYDSARTKKFLSRGYEPELINYRGNVFDFFGQVNEKYRNMYYVLDADQVFSGAFMPEMLRNKIVLFGFMGKFLGDPSWSDKFYTPLNQKLAGKANPDMFGVVIHANIVSMILNEDYIDYMQEWGEYLVAFILCFLNVALFMVIYHRLPDWYDGITKLLQVIELFVIAGLMVLIFHWYSFKLDVTVTLAVIALAGDTLEVYEGVIKNTYERIKNWLTKRRKSVSTSDNA